MLSLALIFWGGSICLFSQYVLQAIFVFSCSSYLFKMVILGLLSCVIEATLVMAFIYYDFNDAVSIALGVCVAFFWFVMIQITTWLSVKRIQSLGYYMAFDSYIQYVPYIVGLLEIPTTLCIILDAWNVNLFLGYYDISSTVFAFLSIILEITLCILLIKKLNFILEYKPKTLSKLAFHIKFMCLLITLLECGIIVSKIMKLPLDFSIRPFTHLLRIYVIIQFYNDLLLSVDQEMQQLDSLKLPSFDDSIYQSMHSEQELY